MLEKSEKTLGSAAACWIVVQARKLFISLEEENERARQLEVEFGQLQLEQSTWAMHSRIEKIATQSLRMRVPDARRIQLVPGAEAVK